MTTLSQQLRQMPQPPQARGGVLDMLGIDVPEAKPEPAPSFLGHLTDKAGRGLAVVDHWAMGIPSTMAGLVNSAIPGQPMGDLWSAKSAAQDARSAVAQSGYADLLSLPDAFMGSLGNVPANARPAAQMAGPAARQAGRIAESAIDPVYNALPDNSVGMFAGKMAKTADTAALARAENMAAKGLPREQIWSDTGWFQGTDGKWRFEIDDSGAMALGVEGKLSDVVPHQTLYQAYPDVGAIDVTHRQMPSNSYGEYSPGQTIGRPWWVRQIDSIVGYEPDPPSIGINPSHRLNTGTHIHETQHAVQDVEGFARGGLADTEVARRLYNRLAGEVEARAVEQRMGLTADERRSRPPWQDYDVPESDQIVRFGGNGPQMSMGDGSAGGKLTPPQGITAYHGSPHDFDRFDMSKIGTGEGAQAYGHGLYFAEAEDVAKAYKDKLGGLRSGFSINGKQYDPIGGNAEISRLAADAKLDKGVAREVLAYFDMTPEQMLADVKRFPSDRDANIAAAAEWKRANEMKSGGRMYEVRINADPGDFLDWDKPLSQQSEKVRGAVQKFANDDQLWELTRPVMDQRDEMRGRDIYEKLGDRMGRNDAQEQGGGVFAGWRRAANAPLADAGIPGIRYLDQGSRNAGEGSRNYVVFRDDIISVVKKYGIAAAISAYGMDQVQQAMGSGDDAKLLPPEAY